MNLTLANPLRELPQVKAKFEMSCMSIREKTIGNLGVVGLAP
jgi:hypothetical protein